MRVKLVLSTVLIMAVLGSVGMYADPDSSAVNPTRKGRLLLDVEFAFSSTKGDVADGFNTETKHTENEFDLQLGYTVIDNLEVGVNVGVSHDNLTVESQTYAHTEKTTTNHMGLFARYFFGKSTFKPFVVASCNFVGNSTHAVVGSPDQKFGITGYGVGAGMIYFVNDHFGVELMAIYQTNKLKDKDSHDFTYDTDHTAVHLLFGLVIAF